MTMEQLPPKGVKREQAILELGKAEANGELLLQLVNMEKGKCKTAAQKALAQLEYAPAAPLWAKLVKGKWMGSHITVSYTHLDVYKRQSMHNVVAGPLTKKGIGHRSISIPVIPW